MIVLILLYMVLALNRLVDGVGEALVEHHDVLCQSGVGLSIVGCIVHNLGESDLSKVGEYVVVLGVRIRNIFWDVEDVVPAILDGRNPSGEI